MINIPNGTPVTIESSLLKNDGKNWYHVSVYIPGSGTSYGYVLADSLK